MEPVYLYRYALTIRHIPTNKAYVLPPFKAASLDNAMVVLDLKCKELGLDSKDIEVLTFVSFITE